MGKRIVIALGGNALGSTPYEQLALVTETAKPIVDLIEQGNEVVIAHGNGPQVGMINLGMATAAEAGAIKSDMPFPECGAMSQGYIGYHLQNAIGNELAARGLQKDVATVVTQVLVDETIPPSGSPRKPVGAFYDKATGRAHRRRKGLHHGRGRGPRLPPGRSLTEARGRHRKEHRHGPDNGRLRRSRSAAAASPLCGDGKLYGTPAVIDKDFASAKLAEHVRPTALVICLTAVEPRRHQLGQVPGPEEALRKLTVAEAEALLPRRAIFARPAPMLPKVRAAVSFCQDRRAGHHRLASSQDPEPAVRRRGGTRRAYL